MRLRTIWWSANTDHTTGIGCFHQAAIIQGKRWNKYSVRHTTGHLIYLNFQEHYVNLQILIRQEQKTKVDVPVTRPSQGLYIIISQPGSSST